MSEEATPAAAPAKKKSSLASSLGKFARDTAILTTVEKGLERGVREVYKNKELRKAGTDMVINYAKNHNRKHDQHPAADGHRRKPRFDDYDDDDDDEDDYYSRSKSSKGKGKGKGKETRETNKPSRRRADSYSDGYSGGSKNPYGDFRDRPPPQAESSSHPRTRKTSSSADSWLERAFGTAPTWNRSGGFQNQGSGSRGGSSSLSRSVSNPGQPRSQSNQETPHGFGYSRDGRGYAFVQSGGAKPNSLPASSSGEYTSPYDVDFRPRQAARREDEERERQLHARQQELGGMAMSAEGIPLYGYRPGEEPRHQSTLRDGMPPGPRSSGGGLNRFFTPLASIAPPLFRSGSGSGGSEARAPIQTRLGTYNTSGSGLYQKVFTQAPEASSIPAFANPQTGFGADSRDAPKKTADYPQTRRSLPPEFRTDKQAGQAERTNAQSHPPPPAPEKQRHSHDFPRETSRLPERVRSLSSSTAPKIIDHSPQQHDAHPRFPTPHITKDTTIQTLSFAARCSQIIYHLSTPPSVKHYLKTYDSHASNPSLLEANYADPSRGTKNWALLRRKSDGAIVVAVRGSGRGLSRGTDYAKDMSWLDDEEWLSDMMLNLKARKWGGGGGGGGGSLSRRNSTGGSGTSQQQQQSSGSSSGGRRSLHLSSIRTADGSPFEAHEGFLKCAMAMFGDVGRALDKKLKMWMVLAASSGIVVEHGGKGGPSASTSDHGHEQQEEGQVGRRHERISPPELIFTGHSAGGAVASLLYVLFDAGNRGLLDRFGKVSVITFGAAAAFPHPRAAPLTHANTHSSRRSHSGRVRDVHLTILHKDDPIPRMDIHYALSLLETALGGPRNASAALMALQTIGSQSKNREVGALVALVKEGAERAREMRKREKEARKLERTAEEVVGGSVPPTADGGGGGRIETPESHPRVVAGMELWPAGDLFLLAPATGPPSGSSSSRREGDGTAPKSILKTAAGSSGSGGTKPSSTPSGAPAGGAMQLYTYTYAQLARSKPTEWAAHRIARYFFILDEMEKRIPGLRV
ncbi:hypothetical protein V8E36_008917 [Tilletia maclaganii]